MANKSTTAGDVLLYIPNLIGYLRVICTVLSLILMICFPQRWIIAIILYVSSFVGDLFDGIAARKFDQCSLFGGLLDMVTDRCSTTGLLCALSHEHTERPILVLVRDATFFSITWYTDSKPWSKHARIHFFIQWLLLSYLQCSSFWTYHPTGVKCTSLHHSNNITNLPRAIKIHLLLWDGTIHIITSLDIAVSAQSSRMLQYIFLLRWLRWINMKQLEWVVNTSWWSQYLLVLQNKS